MAAEGVEGDSGAAHIFRRLMQPSEGPARQQTEQLAHDYLAADEPFPPMYRAMYGIAAATGDAVFLKLAHSLSFKAPEALHDLSGRFGYHMMEVLAPADRALALRVMHEEHPSWAAILEDIASGAAR